MLQPKNGEYWIILLDGKYMPAKCVYSLDLCWHICGSDAVFGGHPVRKIRINRKIKE